MNFVGLLWLSQLRFFLRSPWSTATVLLGVMLGVASVVAVHQVNVRVNESLAAATPVHLAGITHLLERPAGRTQAEHYFALRRQWREGRLPEVSALLPVVEGHVVYDARRVLVFATDWLAASPLQQQELRGLSLLGRDAVIADVALGVAEGATVTVAGVPCSVIATVESGLGPALFTDIGTGAQILATDPNELQYVAAVRNDPTRWLRDALEQALPGSSAGIDFEQTWEVDGWRVRPVGAELPMVGFARSILFNLGALGSLTLVVAWFLIHQVAVVWHRQRRGLMQRLHMLGVSAAALRWGFVGSFVLLGSIATGLGLLVGPLLANLLMEISVSGASQPITTWAVVKGLLSGVGVSLLGAWMACRDDPWHPALRWLLVSTLVIGLLVGLWYEGSGLLGAFVAVFALCLLGVLGVRPLLRQIRARGVRGGTGSLLARMGVREVVWHPAESSVAIGALALAVGASMGVGIMVENFRSDFAAMLDQRLAHDTFVTAAGRSVQQPYQWLRAAAPLTEVQRYGRVRHRLGSLVVELGYTDFTAAETSRYGLARALDDSEALINERLARALDVQPGASLPGLPSLKVAGVFPGFGEPGMRVLVSNATARSMGVATRFDRMSVSRLDPAMLSQWVSEFPWLQVQSRAQMRSVALEIFDRTFAITRVLILLSLLVAAVGMYNALLALRLNQAHSERLLQALGVTDRERRAIAICRAAMVGGASMLLALPLGVGMAWLLCEVVNPRAFGWSLNFSPAIAEIAVPLSLAFLVAMFTGLLPMPPGERAIAEVEGV